MDNKMTWLDLARKHFPDKSDKFLNWVLWEKTAFPMASIATVEKQLQEYKEGGDRENEEEY
jgi:hypothetical protein